MPLMFLKELDSVEISLKSYKLLKKLLNENPRLKKILKSSKNPEESQSRIRKWALSELKKNNYAENFYREVGDNLLNFRKTMEKDLAAIRILDYIDHAGETYKDMNLKGGLAITDPFGLLWLAVKKGTGGAKPYFFIDTIELFRQFRGIKQRKKIKKEKIVSWMKRYYSGLYKKIVQQRLKNRDRIIKILIDKVEDRKYKDSKYRFDKHLSYKQKFDLVSKWWNDWKFHLKFAAKNPEDINKMLDNSLDPDTLSLLKKAEKKGIPFFINPYYLSLLQTEGTDQSFGSDITMRAYVIYSEKLIDEFGDIVAWEKEDEVRPGKPNAAGWILPSYHNVHRRYPDVAILIPETMGRACGGLCSSCQRMYEFQSGGLNFNFKDLNPKVGWITKLESFMSYFQNDSQLRDILITGGDAFMSSDRSLENILNAVLKMAESKIEDNKNRKTGDKFAEITRVRLGTRLLAYLPQRVTDELTKILFDFKSRAEKIGIKQFVVQTHIESPMEITTEMRKAVEKILNAGWLVTNQHVFTTPASRRGHNAKLRKCLIEIGILPYYTFTVKGYMENYTSFVPNARIVQEIYEEKYIGKIRNSDYKNLKELVSDPVQLLKKIRKVKRELNLPFLASDRNVMNLPGVGKSLTFRVIGITRYGRRILEFDHDTSRTHSPIIKKMGKVIIIESKSISEYLNQLEEMGEEISEYNGIFTYSASHIEERIPAFEYPDYEFKITDKLTNVKLD